MTSDIIIVEKDVVSIRTTQMTDKFLLTFLHMIFRQQNFTVPNKFTITITPIEE